MTLDDVLTSSGSHSERPKNFPPTTAMRRDAQLIADRVGILLAAFGEDRKVRSGYRDPASNAAAGGAKSSAHLECKAVDLEDTDGKIKDYCGAHLLLLERLGLWMEDPSRTPTWCHLQIRPAQNRVFKP